MKIIQLPQVIVDSLLSLGIRTEQGQALIAGFRLGHPDLHPDRGEIKVVQASASIEVKDQQDDADKTGLA
jgi:hypothetical protein